MRRAALLLLFAATFSCKSSTPVTTSTPAGPTPVPFADRGVVIEAIDANRLAEAEATLAKAPPTADVHYLRSKLHVAKQEGDEAYREIKKAVEDSPDFAEYQYQLGIVAPLPVGGLNVTQLENRLKVAGVALKKAVELAPHEPRYQYAYAFFLSSAPPQDGGDPSAGKKRFDDLLDKHGDTAWGRRVAFDRAAERGDLEAAEAEAAKVANLDAVEGARLYLLAAGSHLIAGNVEGAKADLEKAAKLRRSSAGGFCDAGYALDGGGRGELADPFWKRCLELDPDGPKAAQARARLGTL